MTRFSKFKNKVRISSILVIFACFVLNLGDTKKALAANAPEINLLTPNALPSSSPGIQGLADRIFSEGFTSLESLATVIVVFYFLWYGVMFVTSGGSPDKAKTAKQALINGVIGVAIMVAAYSFISLGSMIANTINKAI